MRESPRFEIGTNRVSRLRVLVPVKWIIPVPAFRQQMVKIRFEALGVGLDMCGKLGLREPLRKQDSRAVGSDDKARGCGSVVVKTKARIAGVIGGKRARVGWWQFENYRKCICIAWMAKLDGFIDTRHRDTGRSIIDNAYQRP